MANEQNLIKNEDRTPSERRENARKAGIASGEARRLKSAVKNALEKCIPKDMVELRTILEEAGIDTTNDNGIAFAMVLKALKGDLSAASWVRDTAGEKPKDELTLGGDAVVIISGDDKIAD